MSHSVDVRAFRDICTKVFQYLPSLGKLFRRFTEKVAGLATFLAVLATFLARPATFCKKALKNTDFVFAYS